MEEQALAETEGAYVAEEVKEKEREREEEIEVEGRPPGQPKLEPAE
jgi:hypothetical protein